MEGGERQNMGKTRFSSMEIDAIGEIMNISLGASATTLSTLLGAKVNITTPKVKIQNRDEFEFRDLEPAVGVEISYVKGLDGRNIMMFSRNDVRIIVGMMMGMEIPEEDFVMDEMNESAIREVMNQMMGSSATALSEFLSIPVDISTPVTFEITNEREFRNTYFPEDTDQVVVRFLLEIEGKLQSEFMNIMNVGLVKKLLQPFAQQFGMDIESESEETKEDERSSEPVPASPETTMDPAPVKMEQEAAHAYVEKSATESTFTDSAAAPEMETQTIPAVPVNTPVYTNTDASTPTAAYTAPAHSSPGNMDPTILNIVNQMQQSQLEMMKMLKEMKTSGGTSKQISGGEPEKPRKNNLLHSLNSQQFDDIPNGVGEEIEANKEMLMKVPLEISVEIGRTRKPVKDILEYTQGSLVVLDKMAGEQADLYVNGECIAHGDIVVVEDNFGIRITEILRKATNPEILG
jgi:flagellar motor switch protein FliN/FliY